MKARIIKSCYVEAAYRIPLSSAAAPEGLTDAGTNPSRLTGNSYRIDLIAEGPVDPAIGWVVDYADLKRFFEPVRLQLDHRCLSDIPALVNDASPEAVQQWIGEQLRPWPSWFIGVRVSLAAPAGFTLSRLAPDPILELPERIAFPFAAAQSLPQLPAGHPCRELHGHTYLVELAGADLSAFEAPARRLHQQLDCAYINEIPGLEQATAEHIAAWIWRYLVEQGVPPAIVAVQETPNNRCHYFGE